MGVVKCDQKILGPVLFYPEHTLTTGNYAISVSLKNMMSFSDASVFTHLHGNKSVFLCNLTVNDILVTFLEKINILFIKMKID